MDQAEAVERIAAARIEAVVPQMFDLPGMTLLRTAVSALVVVAAGPLDRRDVWVVAGLLHRAADLAGLRWDHAVDQLPGEPHPVGGVPADTPPTHEEVGAGSTFAFRRRPRSFDPVALERRLSR